MSTTDKSIDAIEDDFDDLQSNTQDAIVNYVTEQPITAVIAAFVVGIVVGRLIL